MSNRRSIVYLLILLSLAVGVNLWIDLSCPDRGAVVRRHSLVGGADTAVAMDVHVRGSHSFRMEKTDRWRIVVPFRAVADQAAVDRLADALAFDQLLDSYDVGDVEKLGRSVADFGLDNPRITVRVSWSEGESEVAFGNDVPSGEGVYASVDGAATVYIVPYAVFNAVNRPLDSWRRRTVFRIKPDDVVSIDIRRADVSMRISKTGERWEVLEPKRAMASATAVKRIIDTVVSCEALRFVWPVGAANETATASMALLAGYGLDPEACETVVFRAADGRDHSISFGSAADAGTVYALVHGGNAVATVTAEAKASVSLDMGTLIDGRVFPFEKSAVQRISMIDGDDAYLLARGEGGSWRIDSPVSASADETAVMSLLDKLLVMRSSDLDENGVKVSLFTNAIPVAVARDTLLGTGGFEQLRSRLIFDIDAATVKRLVFSSPGTEKPESVVFDPDRKGWNVDATGRPGVIDADRLNSVLAALSPLKAKKVVRLKVAPDELARYGLENPLHTVAVDRLIEGSVRRNLLIGSRVEGSSDVYATVGSTDAVFVLDGETVDVLTSGVLSR